MNEVKLEIPERVGIKEKELNELKKEESKAEFVYFPGYDDIKNDIIENQERINSNKKEESEIYLENINKFISLLEKVDTEKINKQLYFSYIKYIFHLLNLIKDFYFFKKKFKAIFMYIQFIDEKELFELLEDIIDNNSLTENYCLLAIIKNYYSKMKEFYYEAFESNKPHEKEKELDYIKKCEEYLKLIENLLKKLPFPKLIKQGLEKEINLFPLKIEIRKFLLNYKTTNDPLSNPQQIALDYGIKIGNNISFFFNEIELLSKINKKLEDKNKELSLLNEDDAKELYEILKFRSPREMKFQKKKSEEDFKEEIKRYSKNYNNKKKEPK